MRPKKDGVRSPFRRRLLQGCDAPLAIRAAKSAINAAVQDESRRNEGLIQEMVEACFASNDYTEGYTAFMEKRKPAFQGQ